MRLVPGYADWSPDAGRSYARGCARRALRRRFGVAQESPLCYKNALHRSRLLRATPTSFDRLPPESPRHGAMVCAKEHGVPIEQVAPECARLVDLDQEVEWLASGFGAE